MGCKMMVVAHGKSEVIMAKNLASRMRLKIAVHSLDKGERAIKLEHIGDMLKTYPFDSEAHLHAMYPELDYRQRENVRMPDLMIYPILDRDGDDVRCGSYASGDMFRGSPFYGRIRPILNIDNLEAVIEACGYEPVKDKVRYYERMFSKINVTDFYVRIRESPMTNLDEFLFDCMSCCPPFQGKIANGEISGPLGFP